MNIKFFYFCFVFFAFYSCEKAEIPVDKPSSTTVSTQVDMGSNYANQLFFNIENQEVVLANNREVWDLAFENGSNGKHILLNSSKLMSCAQTTETSFELVNSSSNLNFKYDLQTGNLDSTAIGNWWESANVFVLNRGTNLAGQPIGFIKFKLLSVSETSYELQWAALNSSTFQTTLITKTNLENFTYFSFDDGGKTVTIEPPKTDWHLCFTTYTHLFEDGTPYLVAGVLSNRHEVKVANTPIPFSNLTYSDVFNFNFQESISVIGYDWKIYDFDINSYIIQPEKTFVINSAGKYFKLHFIDFYTEAGVKGAPRFESLELIP